MHDAQQNQNAIEDLGCNHEYKHGARAIESKQSSEVARGQAESGDIKTSAEELAVLLRRVSEAPTHEIEKLIDALQALRKKLQKPVVAFNATLLNMRN